MSETKTQDPKSSASTAEGQEEAPTRSTAVERSSVTDSLALAPIIDQVNERRLALLQRTVAMNATHAEVGMFLELCHRYDLDPFAKEAWCAKGEPKNGKPGKLLIMVGRDGLRKIAQRNGLHLDGDVIREHDDFAMTRTPDGNRTIAHSYGKASDRGPVIGAWAEVREGGPTGKPMGYFYAPLEEYKPPNVSSYSPWSKQVGVMILAAAERQAVRQATPLGGLLAEGEDETINSTADELPAPQEMLQGVPRADEVRAVIERARELGHVGLSDMATAEMSLHGADEDRVESWLEGANGLLDMVAEQGEQPSEDEAPQDATVVEPLAPSEEAAASGAGVADRVAEMRAAAERIEEEAAGADEEAGDQLQQQAAELRAEADAIENAEQGSLLDGES